MASDLGSATSPLIIEEKLCVPNTEPDNRGYAVLRDGHSPFLEPSGNQGWRKGGPGPMSAAQRVVHFWSRINRTDGCWLWTGGCTKDGYGLVGCGRYADGRVKNDYAHRIAYMLTRGKIPDGLVIRHRCDNPPCCNPNHLLLGTQADNIADAQRQGKYKGEKPHLWTLDPSVRPAVIAECLTGPRGTIARLAREHGVSKQSLYMAVMRARRQQRRKAA